MGFLSVPLALLGLIGLPVLGGIYWLRNRFHRQQVSSLILWSQFSRAKEGGRKLQRIQTPLLFFLELLILLLLIGAAVRPMIAGRNQLRHLLVVLDDSYSMLAGQQDNTARSRALKLIEKQIGMFGQTRTRFILAGPSPRVLGAAVSSLTEARMTLQQWTCQSQCSDLDQAVILARQLSRQWTEIMVVTDHAPEQVPADKSSVLWFSVGQKGANPAILNAVRSDIGDRDRILVEVADLSARTGKCELLVQTESLTAQPMIIARKPLVLHNTRRQRVILDLKAGTASVSVQLNCLTPDVLSVDNKAILLPTKKTPVRVQFFIKDKVLHSLLEKTISAADMSEIVHENPELIITDSAERLTDLMSNTWQVSVIRNKNALCYTGPYMVDRSDSLLSGISLQGVIWAAHKVTDPNDKLIQSGKPVVLVGNVPLVTVNRMYGRSTQITINFTPELSTLQNSPNWPILIQNILSAVIMQRAGPDENNLRLGTLVPVHLPGLTKQLIMQSPDKSEQVLPFSDSSRIVSVPTDICGLYQLTAFDSNQVRIQTWKLSVNALNPDESNISMAVTDKWGDSRKSTGMIKAFACISSILLLVALVVMVIHLVLLNRKTGRVLGL